MECLCSLFSEMERHCKYDDGTHVNAGELCGPVVKSRSQPQHRNRWG